jgi:hypothetical protein
MPTMLREAGYCFQSKVWLRNVRVAKSAGFGDVELARMMRIVSDNRVRLLEAWDEFFG